jgi:hypothetical protein
MAGMPKLQEQISAGARMARHIGNERAVFGIAGRDAGNAGAFFGWRLDGPTHRKRRSSFSAMAAGMPKLHEHISAGGPEVSTSRPVDLRSSVLTR